MRKITSLTKFMDPGKFTGEKREKLRSKMETFLDGFLEKLKEVYSINNIETDVEFANDLISYVNGEPMSEKLNELFRDQCEKDRDVVKELMDEAECNRFIAGSYFNNKIELNVSRSYWYVFTKITITFVVGYSERREDVEPRKDPYGCKMSLDILHSRETVNG